MLKAEQRLRRAFQRRRLPAFGRAEGQKGPAAEVAADAWLGQTVAPASSPQAGSPSEKPEGAEEGRPLKLT